MEIYWHCPLCTSSRVAHSRTQLTDLTFCPRQRNQDETNEIAAKWAAASQRKQEYFFNRRPVKRLPWRWRNPTVDDEVRRLWRCGRLQQQIKSILLDRAGRRPRDLRPRLKSEAFLLGSSQRFSRPAQQPFWLSLWCIITRRCLCDWHMICSCPNQPQDEATVRVHRCVNTLRKAYASNARDSLK